jgi:GPH family glycoside/pentoside/hexuronide:cation symporter
VPRRTLALAGSRAADHTRGVALGGKAPRGDASPPAPGGPGPARGRLPLGLKLTFGLPSFAGAAMAIPIAIHLTIFYSDVVLVPLGFIALAKAISRAFDALTDPLMGWVSDRTRTRFGRRRPWIALGAPLCAVSFYALFSPPEGLAPGTAIAWLLGAYVLYYLFHTVYVIPHYGLGPEITQDYHERSSLFGIQEMCSVAGTLVAAVLPGLFVGWLGARAGYSAFAAVFGALLIALYANLVLRIRERRDFVERPPNPLVPGMRRVMRNRVFRILLTVYVIGAITGAIPGMMMPYFTKYVLRPEDPDRWLGIFLAIYFASGFVCLPLWMRAARRFGKKRVWLASFVSGFTGSLALFFVGEGDLAATALILAWAGSSFGARLFLGPAIQADVIDYDELFSGKRREAQYASLWSVTTKFTVIPSMSVPLAVLASLGYAPNVEQTETLRLAIRAIFALAPALSAFVAFVVAWSYPISEEVHRRIWDGIAAHRRGEEALDPVTGARVPPPAGRGVDEDTGWFLDHFSPSELRRFLARGATPLVWGSLGWAALCLLLALAGSLAAWLQVTDLERDPGLRAVLDVVVAGFALTGLVHHGVRARAALALRRAPVEADRVRRHLAMVRQLDGG